MKRTILFVVGFIATYYLLTSTGGFRAGYPASTPFGRVALDGEWVKVIFSLLVGQILPKFLPKIWVYLEPVISGLKQDNVGEQVTNLQTGVNEIKVQLGELDKYVRAQLGGETVKATEPAPAPAPVAPVPTPAPVPAKAT